MKTLICLFLSLVLPLGGVHRKNFEDAVVSLCAVSSVEELSEDEIERFRRLEAFPLRLNHMSRERLLSCGLFSSYRVATLLDYRSRYGDVLSLSELASVDGFQEDFVSALAPFISLDPRLPPGQTPRDGLYFSHDAATGASIRYNGEQTSWKNCNRYDLVVNDSYELGLACRFPDSRGSFHLSFDVQGRHLSKLLLGAFNCRFGQGLAMWSGFSISAAASASNVCRNPGTISAYHGYDFTTSLRGVAASFSFPSRRKLLLLNTFVSHPGIAGVNLNCMWRNAQLGTTSYVSIGRSAEGRMLVNDAKLAVDYRFNLRGADFFGEASADLLHLAPAFLSGARIKAGDALKLAAILRWYSSGYYSGYAGALRSTTKCSDEHALALLADWNTRNRRHNVCVSVDISHKSANRSADHAGVQVKSQFIYKYGTDGLALRLSYRFRDWEDARHRTSLRADYGAAIGDWTVSARTEGQYCVAFSGLLYLEAGWSKNIYARVGAFHADRWEDRLYCYERDAPGNFNVPVLSGRGVWESFVAFLRLPCGFKLSFRAASTQYLMTKDKKPKVESRLQLDWDFSHRGGRANGKS